MRCQSQNKSDTKLFRVYLFIVFTIKRPRALASLAPLGLKTVTNILLTITYTHNGIVINQIVSVFNRVMVVSIILLIGQM